MTVCYKLLTQRGKESKKIFKFPQDFSQKEFLGSCFPNILVLVK